MAQCWAFRHTQVSSYVCTIWQLPITGVLRVVPHAMLASRLQHHCSPCTCIFLGAHLQDPAGRFLLISMHKSWGTSSASFRRLTLQIITQWETKHKMCTFFFFPREQLTVFAWVPSKFSFAPSASHCRGALCQSAVGLGQGNGRRETGKDDLQGQ